MDVFLLGLGLVIAFEGLVFALLPDRLEELIKTISEIPLETRRAFGLIAVAAGVLLIWIARAIA